MSARGPFYVHLADAIAINRARAPIYARLSGGRSRWFSRLLVGFELTSLPFAVWIDRRARPFLARGVRIVEDDFLPMTAIRPPEAPPRWRRVALPSEWQEAEAAVGGLTRALRRALRGRRPDLAFAAEASYRALLTIEALERSTETHHAMARHFVEAVGLAALNGIAYAAATGGETVPLTRDLLRVEALGLPFVHVYDRLAQPLHALGVGALVNDVPDIPFAVRWVARCGSLGGPSQPPAVGAR